MLLFRLVVYTLLQLFRTVVVIRASQVSISEDVVDCCKRWAVGEHSILINEELGSKMMFLPPFYNANLGFMFSEFEYGIIDCFSSFDYY